MSNTFSTKVSGKVSSRGWAIALGLGAIVLATILLIVYLDRYRARVGGENAPTPVLVAKQTIRAGTPGSIVASAAMYADTTLPRRDVDEGAIADPQFLVGRAAVADIFPGQQLSLADFAAVASTTVDSQITGSQRAISITIDAIHGSLAQVKAGDSVDVYIADTKKPGYKLFKPAVKVITVPTPAGGSLMLQMDTKETAKFMVLADHTRMYWAIRPIVGAKPTSRNSATLDQLTR
jgi:Flp pilus assembly protein CpaB